MSTVYHTCNRCQKPKDRSSFYRDSSAKTGLRTICKNCDTLTRLKLFYKVDAASMWGSQNGACLMCGERMVFGGTSSNSMVVDHDRTCCSGDRSCGGCVRGLLHMRCNLILGEYESAGFNQLYALAQTYLNKAAPQTFAFVEGPVGRPSHSLNRKSSRTSSGSRKESKHTSNCRYRVDFSSMWQHQKGLCAVCSKNMLYTGRSGSSASVDHDRSCCAATESCGRCVRGLVHKRCNVVLGRVESLEHKKIFDLSKSYLDRFHEKR